MTRHPGEGHTREGILALLACLALSSGCVRPPEIVIEDAKTSLRRARDAQAKLYAPEAYQSAEETMAKGLAEIDIQKHKTVFSRSYGKAAVLLMKAMKLADRATTRAREQRQETKAEAETLVNDAHQALNVARDAVEVIAGKGEIRSALQDRVASTGKLLSRAENDLAHGKYLAARDEAENASARANEIIDAATQPRRS